MDFSLVIGHMESLTSYYLALLLFVTGMILRFRYYIAYRDRRLMRDAAYAKGGSYVLLILSAVVWIAHYFFT